MLLRASVVTQVLVSRKSPFQSMTYSFRTCH